MDKGALEAHDYVFDVFPAAEAVQRAVVQSGERQTA
jgi:hypothetical protein